MTLRDGREELVDYYVALETILSESTRVGYDEYRTHFGPALGPAPDDYCWLRTSVDPLHNLRGAEFIASSFTELEQRLTGDLDHNPPESVLDVGCGAGGTIRSLADRWPHAKFTGININDCQLGAAHQILDPYGDRVELLNANFFDLPVAGRKFDFIYFIESAFHMREKQRVLELASGLLNPGGRLRFVDVFLGDRAARLSANALGGTRHDDSIFTYQPRSTWVDDASSLRLRHELWHEFGRDVSSFLSINTSWEEMRSRYVAPRLSDHPRRDDLTECLHGLHSGYVRLARLLRSGLVEYGVLGFRR